MRFVVRVAAALFWVAARAHAQTPAAAPAELVAPAPLEVAEAAYPESAGSGTTSVVVLRLAIDIDGRVSEADVHNSGGADFDRAALDAAKSFRFSPALRRGVPVASRILYEVEFRPPPASEPVTPTAPAASVASESPKAGSVPETPVRALNVTPATQAAPQDIVVRGQTAAGRLRDSARAVLVIETTEAKKQSSDLGEVLARSPGIAVRRDGGLGSATRLSLNGLSDDQIRVFLDGVPLELAGYSSGIANVPVNLLTRVDVYRGVVPIRFGADALGGAINLVTDDDVRGTRGFASYQTGSFGTHRLAVGVRTHDAPSGFFLRANAYHDVAENDYPIDIVWPNELGKPETHSVDRFHDAYRATGANVEAGLVQRPWAKRLVFSAFASDHEKELQHGTVVTVPYGDIESRRTTAGGTARYMNLFGGGVVIDALAGYTHQATHYLEPDVCFYDWWGQCLREPEIQNPSDYLTRTNTIFSRLHLDWHAVPEQQVFRVSLAPTFSTIVGDERAKPDPNDGDQRELLTTVAGLEHELSLVEGRLINVAFVKGYLQAVRADKHVGDFTLSRDRNTLTPGVGDSLRYRLTSWLSVKASYEWATRLPTLAEIFGDGVLTLPNLEIEPETSHNGNLGLALALDSPELGQLALEANAFVRNTKNQILLQPTGDLAIHNNVFSARSLGAEAFGSYTARGEYVTLTGNITYFDYRNTSTEGAFAPFYGDRIPNRPYFFVNLSARGQLRGVATPRDNLSLTWFTRYVHDFFRSWESVGQRDLKQVIPTQLLHSVVLVYELRIQTAAISNAVEVQNLTDQAAYDHFGVQRPGRAFYYKLTAEL